jgi:general secretion pathway protein A
MLSNLQTDNEVLLQIMLVGQPELNNRLNRPGFQQLAQRIAVNYHIEPLNAEETYSYIAYRMQSAGGSPSTFTPDAYKQVFKHSGGIPRTINLICDTALVYGFADKLERIDATVIEKVIEDKVCMATDKAKPAEEAARIPSDSAQPQDSEQRQVNTQTQVMERIQRLEASLSELKREQERFAHEVKDDLLVKYRQVLVAERKRYDQLMEKYNHLLQRCLAKQEIVRQKNGKARSDAPARTVAEGQNVAHFLKMVAKNNPDGGMEE